MAREDNDAKNELGYKEGDGEIYRDSEKPVSHEQ